MVRFGAFWAVTGIIVNRINVSIIALNWNLPHHLSPYHSAVEGGHSGSSIATIHVLIFRWILNRMPVLHAHPDYKETH